MKKNLLIALLLLCFVLSPPGSRLQGKDKKTPAKNESWLLQWAPHADDFIVWAAYDKNNAKRNTTGAFPDDRVLAFGRSISANGTYSYSPYYGGLGWGRYGHVGPVAIHNPLFMYQQCPQFQFLGYLPGTRKKPGDTWSHTFKARLGLLQPRIKADYKFIKIIQVPNFPSKKGSHPEALIEGKGTFIAPKPTDDYKIELDKGKRFVWKWTATYDPARKIVTGGTIEIEAHVNREWTQWEYEWEIVKEGPYPERKIKSRKKVGVTKNSYTYKSNLRFELEKYYPPNHPRQLFVEERSRVLSKGIEYLRAQAKTDGRIFYDPNKDGGINLAQGGHEDGQSALAVYALLKCDVRVDDNIILKGLDHLLEIPIKSYKEMYTPSLTIMAAEEFLHQIDELKKDKKKRKKLKIKASAFSKKRIKLLQGLLKQLTKLIISEFNNKKQRGWGYIKMENNTPSEQLGYVDHSNMQFVALALDALERYNSVKTAKLKKSPKLKLPIELWEGMLEGILKNQLPSGAWNYGPDWNSHPYLKQQCFNMTCAALACVLFAKTHLQKHEKLSDAMKIKADKAIKSGLGHLNGAYVEWNPRTSQNLVDNYYYLYGLERAATLTGISKLKKRDWYRENALVLFQVQLQDGRWRRERHGHVVSTCFALLFLNRVTQTLTFRTSDEEKNNR